MKISKKKEGINKEHFKDPRNQVKHQEKKTRKIGSERRRSRCL